MTPANQDDVVVDTNVLVMAHKLIEAHETSADRDCAAACREWLTQLRDSTQRFVVDFNYAILKEYWGCINDKRSSLVSEMLVELARTDKRVKRVNVEFDRNDCAVLPPDLTLDLEAQDSKINSEDWKFIAVALICDPHAPIVNATDTDWARNREVLEKYDLRVEELCQELIEQAINRRP